jgi:hypothetical protein
VLTVGAPDFPLGYGIPVDFNSIGAAMDAIPLFDPDLPPSDPNWHNPVEQWTILVTPGYYPEVVRFKPFVNVVGFRKEAVIIAGQTPDVGPLGAQVYLCSNSLLSNVTLAIRGDSVQGDFVVRGYDVNNYPGVQHLGDVHFLGLDDVDFFPYPPFPPAGDGHPLGGGLIKFDGPWRTVIFRNVGGNYDAPDGYGIELTGQFQNADCHFINCFFDALHMGGMADGGYVRIRDCFEVHIRNSLIRVGYSESHGDSPISAVAISKSPGDARRRPREVRPTAFATRPPDLPPRLTNVLIEGSSLYGPGERVLDIGADTFCFFRHSFSESKFGDGTFITSGLDGIGNR